jgi:hypothetical protein
MTNTTPVITIDSDTEEEEIGEPDRKHQKTDVRKTLTRIETLTLKHLRALFHFM